MIGRRAGLQIAAGVGVLAALWGAGWLDTAHRDDVPAWLRPAQRTVHWLGGGPPPESGAAEALALALIDYGPLTPEASRALAEARIVLRISIGGEPAGEIVIEPMPDWAPQNVQHLARLVREGLLDGTRFIRPCATGQTFPRVDDTPEGPFAAPRRASRFDFEPSALIGGIAPAGAVAAPGADLMVAGEFHDDLRPAAGMVGMMRMEDPVALDPSTPPGRRGERPDYFDSATRRFFVYFDEPRSDAPRLDPVWEVAGRFSMVGRVRCPEGLALLKRIGRLETDSKGRPFEPVVIESATLPQDDGG